MLNFDILLTLKTNNQLFVDTKRIRLLKAIYQTGSLSQAAKTIGMSYKAAWDALNDINTLADKPFVITLTGGKGGGGTKLSPYAIRFIELYDLLATMQTNAFNILKDETIPLNDILKVASRVSLQSSSRNQVYGVITEINDASGFITVLLQDQQTKIIANITHSSIERLNLMVSKAVILLIKSPQIELIKRTNSNQYTTHIESVSHNQSSCDLALSLASGITLYTALSSDEFTYLKLKQGDPLTIYIHPDNIIVTTLL